MISSRRCAAAMWLDDFMDKRGYDGPNGQHLFSYQATSEEFETLHRVLRDLAAEARAQRVPDPFSLHSDDTAPAAAFVLYASLFWQKHYDGSRLVWDKIWKSLDLVWSENMEAISRSAVGRGLRWWNLAPNSSGHKYIGTTLREAGFPQKLLAEGHGRIGDVLRKLLDKALAYQEPEVYLGPHIKVWAEELSADLPDSYKGQGVIASLLSDTVKAILRLKSHLKSQTAAEALVELEQRFPDWRREFPFPLDEENSRRLLERLLGEAVDTLGRKAPGKPIRMVRRLVHTMDGRWKLHAHIEFPENVSLISSKLDARNVGVYVKAGECERGPIFLRRRAENDRGEILYFVLNRQEWSFHGADAAAETVLRCSSASGAMGHEDCVGGTELDEDLPWVFEAEGYDFAFCQQGGGKVRGTEACVALRPGWSVDGAEKLGILEGFDRVLWKICTPSLLYGAGESYAVSFGGRAPGETLDWRLDQRSVPELIWPKLASRGRPQAMLRTEDGETRCIGVLRWKTSLGGTYSPFLDRPYSGPAYMDFQCESGASLRSSMLLLKSSAKFSVKPDKGEGKLFFEDWGFSSVALAAGQPDVSLSCEVEARRGRFTITLASIGGAIPPESVDLLLHWEGCVRDVHIRVPFPQRGVRMFDRQRKLVEEGGKLCVSSLQGVRLHFFGLDPKAVCFNLFLRRDRKKILAFPLRAESGSGEIWMLDWQKRLFEMLALDSGLDALVELECISDGTRIGFWRFARYAEKLERGEGIVSLPCGENGGAACDIRAMLLTRPDMEPVPLALMPDEGDGQTRWSLASLDMCGPWLIYDQSADSALRPLLHNVEEGESPGELDRLQLAIGREGMEERANAFRACIHSMLEDCMAPEWATLFSLFKRLSHLPLSTMEIWKELVLQPRAMAVLALHQELDFVSITARSISELPFLWSLVSWRDWAFAAGFVRERCEKRLGLTGHSEAFEYFWCSCMEERLDLLKAYSPSVYDLACLALELPGEKWEKKRCETAHFKSDALSFYLFNRSSEGAPLQRLLRSHADVKAWPEQFCDAVARAKKNNPLKAFFPTSKEGVQKWQTGVVGLPILLTLQNAVSKPLSRGFEPSPDLVFHIRQHISFDPEWFEEASNRVAACCFAEKLHYHCEVE